MLNPCSNILQVDPNNDEANSFMADYHFMKNESDKAITSYQVLLNANPRGVFFVCVKWGVHSIDFFRSLPRPVSNRGGLLSEWRN
uniref:TPR_REGION domain-containing protein n=1 Tax=Caenorhabditis japonica TaxID=281687 RepID=A0A8R1IE09_CAEJA